jgi:hypothetical protein
MATSYYTTSGILGVRLGGVDSSASPQFAPLTAVDVYAANTSAGGIRKALYVKVANIVSASTSTVLALGGIAGTVSLSAGGLIALNETNAAAGDWIWARTSASGIA